MAQNVNRAVSVDALFQLIWGTDSLEDTRTVAVHISNLRKKSRLTLPILRESLLFAGQVICWLSKVHCKCEHSVKVGSVIMTVALAFVLC